MLRRILTPRHRILRNLAVVSIGMTATVVGLSAMERRPSRLGNIPEFWIADHPSDLPTNLAELAAYPREYRMSIIRVLPETIRVDMIRQHIEDVLIARTDLSATQRQYLQNLRGQLNGASATGRFSDISVAKAECSIQKDIFPDKTMRSEIGGDNIGGYTRASVSARAVGVWAKEFARVAAMKIMPVAAADDEVECNCNRTNAVCDCGVTCKNQPCQDPGVNSCTNPYIGCLFVTAVVCNGFCPGEDDGKRLIKR